MVRAALVTGGPDERRDVDLLSILQILFSN